MEKKYENLPLSPIVPGAPVIADWHKCSVLQGHHYVTIQTIHDRLLVKLFLVVVTNKILSRYIRDSDVRDCSENSVANSG